MVFTVTRTASRAHELEQKVSHASKHVYADSKILRRRTTYSLENVLDHGTRSASSHRVVRVRARVRAVLYCSEKSHHTRPRIGPLQRLLRIRVEVDQHLMTRGRDTFLNRNANKFVRNRRNRKKKKRTLVARQHTFACVLSPFRKASRFLLSSAMQPS